MSSDWHGDLTPGERDEFAAFVEHFRRDALAKMTDSAFVMSLVPDAEKLDVKFALELGAAIMLDKPILAVVAQGVEVPPRLRLVVDEVVEADLDTAAGQRKVAAAIAAFQSKLG